MSLYSQRQATNVFKKSSCCKVFGCLHTRCAKNFSQGIIASYKFDALTYENDNSMPLYCYVCRTGCFYCSKRHTTSQSKSDGVFIESCSNCTKWCYTTQNCKGDIDESLCVECKNITQDKVKIDNNLATPFISPITTECDPEKFTSIHKAITVLLEGIHTSPYELKQYRNYFKRKLTHLHPNLHNIFSPNKINPDPVEGLFLSSFSVFKFLAPENEFEVTEELFNFFVNLFNFHDEFDPFTTRTSLLRNIVFCKTTDEVEKINVLYKNSNEFSDRG